MPTRKISVRLGLVFLIAAGHAWGQKFSEIKPRPQQVEWQDLEIGVIVHFGWNTFTIKEWGEGGPPGPSALSRAS